MVTGGLVTLLFGVPLAAALSDRIGRKPVMLAGVIAQLLLGADSTGLVCDDNVHRRRYRHSGGARTRSHCAAIVIFLETAPDAFPAAPPCLRARPRC